MGQYYMIVNLDKKQFLDPHKFGNGLKLCEFGSGLTMMGLAVLLSEGNGQGGGDLFVPEENPFCDLIGSWAGDRIVVTGDYAEPNNFVPVYTEVDPEQKEKRNLYNYVTTTAENTNIFATGDGIIGVSFEDISDKVVLLLAEDEYFYERLVENIWSPEYKLEKIFEKYSYTPENVKST